MNPVHRLGWGRWARVPAVALAAGLGLVVAGCGTPGAPMPPSLKLPEPVNDLSAVRTGNQVALTWTMPKKNTDKLLLKGSVTVEICRQEVNEACAAAAELELAPGAEGGFTDALPAAEASGAPRALTYLVELKNAKKRSAGPSNAAVVVAGEAPAPVEELIATVTKAGVVLHWRETAAGTAVRLHRKLLTPPAAHVQQGPLAPAPEPLERSLLVEAGARDGRALDKDIRFGETYEYRAQRVDRVTVNGETLELAGPLSGPVRVEAQDVFPPEVPAGLVAVASVAEAGVSIDLSWQPDTETDLAGYAVYRREGDGGWRRISPAEPLVGPAFHDDHVERGHTYSYAVTAIDQSGRESARSGEAEETVPNP